MSDMNVVEWWVEKNVDNEPWARWCVMGAWDDEFSGGSFCHSAWPLKREATIQMIALTTELTGIE